MIALPILCLFVDYIGLFGAMVVLSKLSLSDWHESEIGAET